MVHPCLYNKYLNTLPCLRLNSISLKGYTTFSLFHSFVHKHLTCFHFIFLTIVTTVHAHKITFQDPAFNSVGLISRNMICITFFSFYLSEQFSFCFPQFTLQSHQHHTIIPTFSTFPPTHMFWYICVWIVILLVAMWTGISLWIQKA